MTDSDNADARRNDSNNGGPQIIFADEKAKEAYLDDIRFASDALEFMSSTWQNAALGLFRIRDMLPETSLNQRQSAAFGGVLIAFDEFDAAFGLVDGDDNRDESDDDGNRCDVCGGTLLAEGERKEVAMAVVRALAASYPRNEGDDDATHVRRCLRTLAFRLPIMAADLPNAKSTVDCTGVEFAEQMDVLRVWRERMATEFMTMPLAGLSTANGRPFADLTPAELLNQFVLFFMAGLPDCDLPQFA